MSWSRLSTLLAETPYDWAIPQTSMSGNSRPGVPGACITRVNDLSAPYSRFRGTTNTTGTRYRAAVQSALTVWWNAPSPIIAKTRRDGSQSCSPIAAGSPHPRPPDAGKNRLAGREMSSRSQVVSTDVHSCAITVLESFAASSASRIAAALNADEGDPASGRRDRTNTHFHRIQG